MWHISPTDLLARTFRNGMRWMHIFLPIALVVVAASNYGSNSVISILEYSGFSDFWRAWSLLLLGTMALYLVQMSVFDAVLEERGDWLVLSFDRAARRLLPALLGVVVFLVLYVIGVILLVIPGLMAMVLFGMMMPLILLDRVGPFKAVQESFDLVWGNAWLFIAALLLLLLPILAVMLPAMYFLEVMHFADVDNLGMLDFSRWQSWVWLLLNALTGTFYLVFYLEAFRDLKKVRDKKRAAISNTTA